MNSDFESDSISTNPADEDFHADDATKSTQSSSGRTFNRWSQEEDELLQILVNQFGTDAWAEISARFKGTRTARQCRDRWYGKLDQNMCRDPWTPEEDAILMDRHRTFGNKWKKISEHLPLRTHQSIRNRYQVLSKREEKAKMLLLAGQELPQAPRRTSKRKKSLAFKGLDRGNEAMESQEEDSMDSSMEVCTKFEVAAKPEDEEYVWDMTNQNWVVSSWQQNQRTPRAFYSLQIDDDFLPSTTEATLTDPRSIRFPPPHMFMDFFSSPRNAPTTIPAEDGSD